MVLVLRTNQPDFLGGGNTDRAGHCTKFNIDRKYDPWFNIGDSWDEAVEICNGDSSGVVCPKRHDCLIFSLINNEAHGIWGGMYPDDRTQLRRFTPRDKWQWHEPTEREPSLPVEPDK